MADAVWPHEGELSLKVLGSTYSADLGTSSKKFNNIVEDLWGRGSV